MAKAPRFETLTASMPLAEAARTIERGLLVAVLEATPRVLRGDDVEAVHDERVAIRRLRTALDSFRKPLGGGIEPFERTVRRLGRRLGAVRDADVHLAALRGALGGATVDETPGIVSLLESISAERRRALAAVAVEMSQFDSDRFFAALDDAARRSRHTRPLGRYVYDTVRKQLDNVRKRGDRIIERGGADELHALRVAFKRLRYRLEYFRSILSDDVDAALTLLAKAQDRLGSISDDDAFSEQYATMLASLDASDPRRAGIEARRASVIQGRKHELAGLRSLWNGDGEPPFTKRLRASVRAALEALS